MARLKRMTTAQPQQANPSTQKNGAPPPWLSIEACNLPAHVACDCCETYQGDYVNDCSECDGIGYIACIDCKKGAEGKCGNCSGTRELKCEECNGTGEETEEVGCYDCEEVREGVADAAAYLWRRDIGRDVTNGTAALYIGFAAKDYEDERHAKAESEAG